MHLSSCRRAASGACGAYITSRIKEVLISNASSVALMEAGEMAAARPAVEGYRRENEGMLPGFREVTAARAA